MSILLETTLGDIVIDLDVEGSPELCKNVLKLAKARYYSQSLVYNVQANRFCQLGDPHGDGTGGACAQGLISSDGSLSKVLRSQQRFLKSSMGRPLTPEECKQKGRVVATEMKGIPDTIGSQLLITTCEGQDMALDGYSSRIRRADDNDENQSRQLFRSIGMVVEDENNILDQIGSAFCDADGRPYADVRIIRALIVDDPFEDPEGMEVLYKARGVEFQQKKQEEEDERVIGSPEWERPPEEVIEERIPADQVESLTGEESMEKLREREEEYRKKQDKSRAVVLEMLGDLPSADITAPENVLFVCKLNPVTEDEDLELIFSRFDEQVKAEIIRDPDTGNSLQYAFIEFTKKEQAVEAYFKMNNALVDDRRIKVDFSQSVSKVWDKYNQRMRTTAGGRSNSGMPRDPFGGGPPRRGPGPPHSSRGGPPRRNDRDFRRNGPPNHDRRHQDNRGHYGRPQNDRPHNNDRDDRRRDDHHHRGREPPHRHSQDNHHRPPHRGQGRDDNYRDHGRQEGHRGHGRDQEHRGNDGREEHHGEVDQFGREIRRDTRPPPPPREGSLSDAGSVDSRRRDRHRRKHRKEKRKHHRSRDKKHRKRRSSRDGDYSSEGSSRSRSLGRDRDHEGHREHRRSSGDRRSHHDEPSSRGDRGGEAGDPRDGNRRRDRRERSRSRSGDRDRRRRRSRSRSHSNDERRRERSRDGKRKDRDRHRHEDDNQRSEHHDRKRRRRHDSPDR
mmetsp:Transcript_44705/g.107865  ORF Transcript_44705/g.107865 Transcript_44705/m.107865 type:complete len:729 (-) Transcript_44705:1693-3879(-)